MAVSSYLDHNVERVIADGLRRRGVDLLTAHDDGRHRADDSALIDRATALGHVAVSSELLAGASVGEYLYFPLWEATGDLWLATLEWVR